MARECVIRRIVAKIERKCNMANLYLKYPLQGPQTMYNGHNVHLQLHSKLEIA